MRKYLEWAARDEQISGLQTRLEITGFSSGQTNGFVVAILGGRVAGRIDFGEFDDEVFIKFIEVDPEFQRQGVGTELINKLKEEFPGEPIRQLGGFATAAGAGFSRATGIR